MADPQIDNAVRAQCIWKGASGLPTDRFVTSWAFVRIMGSITAGAQEQADEVAERLREFWLEPLPVSARTIASYLPRTVTTQGLEVRCYDLGQALPREPRVYNFPTTLGAVGAEVPREVAVTLSFYSERNLPRRRGRVYIGPLSVTKGLQSSGIGVPLEFRTDLCAAADRLANAEGAADVMNWGVLSQTTGEIHGITNGWVDDAHDTIRSRGQDPSARTLFGAA